MTEQKRHWFDASINVQTLATGIIGAALSLTVAYFTLVQRVALIEADITNIKAAQHDKQISTDNSLIDIKGSVKDTNDKIDKLQDFLMRNSAGQRSDMQRWSK